MKSEESRALGLWQRIMLPVTVIFIIVAALAFAYVTIDQLGEIRNDLTGLASILQDGTEFAESLNSFEVESISDYQRKALIVLEAHTLERRYHLLISTLLTRTWIKYLGFFSGMILAFVGGIFILGKLQEEATTVQLRIERIIADFKTTSPGILMAAFGVILMVTTIFVNHDIEFRDGAAYAHPVGFSVPEAVHYLIQDCFTAEEFDERRNLILISERSQEQQRRYEELDRRFKDTPRCGVEQ